MRLPRIGIASCDKRREKTRGEIVKKNAEKRKANAGAFARTTPRKKMQFLTHLLENFCETTTSSGLRASLASLSMYRQLNKTHVAVRVYVILCHY